MAEDDNLSFQETLDAISRFLEAAVHTIVCIRQVYPADIFERKKLYDVPVWRSRHPKLSSYIAQVVDAIVDRVQDGTIEQAIVAIKDAASDEALEHFVFSFTWLAGATASMYATEQDRERRPLTGTPRSHVDLLLRAFMLKIASIDSQLVDLPPELTFTVFIEMTPGSVPPTDPDPVSGEAAPWVPDQTKEANPPRQHVPIRAAALGVIQMQLFAEETEAKLDLERRKRSADKGKGRAPERD